MSESKPLTPRQEAKWTLAKIGDIKANPNNPRVIKDDKFKKLVESIRNFPKMMELRPIVVNSDMVVLGGNMRLKACKELGLKTVPIIMADDLTEEQQREFIIKDNVGFGEWDWELLTKDWDAVELGQWGLDTPDFGTKEAKDDGFEVPEGGIETNIVLGDMFAIGPHRLLCGDSTKPETFTKLFGDQTADMVLTDPPYNVAYEGKTKAKLRIENDKQSDGDFYAFLLAFYTSQLAVVKNGGAWYIWFSDVEVINFAKAFVDAGIKLAQMLIWKKNSMVMGRKDYHFIHEPCLYGWKEGAAHGWYSDRKQTTILNFDRPNRNGEHPTMKPVELFAYQIGNSSKQGDVVADAFGGSGTTMVACHQMQRRGFLVEFDPRYCQVIIDRMIALDPSIEIKKNGEPYGKD